MSPELGNAVHWTLMEGFDRFDAARPERDRYLPRGDIGPWLREHFLDRWPRFAVFGVTGRADLAALRVVFSTVDGQPLHPSWGAVDTSAIHRTTVDLKGTKLENK